MPFKSEKQRSVLWKNHPEIAQEWDEPVQESNETIEEFSPIQEVTEEEVKQVSKKLKKL